MLRASVLDMRSRVERKPGTISSMSSETRLALTSAPHRTLRPRSLALIGSVAQHFLPLLQRPCAVHPLAVEWPCTHLPSASGIAVDIGKRVLMGKRPANHATMPGAEQVITLMFDRGVFSEAAAEKWWLENREWAVGGKGGV